MESHDRDRKLPSGYTDTQQVRPTTLVGIELFASTVILFILASVIQTGLISLQQASSRLSKWWGSRAFFFYNIITLIPWVAFVLSYVVLQFEAHPPLPLEGRWLQIIGGILFLSGTSLALWVAKLMGPARLNGLRHFAPELEEERVTSGPFQWLKNPMYTGYFLVLLGVAFSINSLYDLAIALESLLLLNGIQARIENRGLSYHP